MVREREGTPMRYRPLGGSGLLVSVTGLGCNNFGRRLDLAGTRDRVEGLAAWAEARGLSLLEVAVGGLAAQPGCASVIAGATSPEQVKANAAASGWLPSADDLAELDKIVPPPGRG
jgi:aryl-alcohol dehydrogenase-like predicted oxidoreductase